MVKYLNVTKDITFFIFFFLELHNVIVSCEDTNNNFSKENLPFSIFFLKLQYIQHLNNSF